MQLKGVHFFEPYAPVVHWMTVRLMKNLEVLLGLKSKHGNMTAAFLHSDLVEDEKIFVDMLRGFEVKEKNDRDKVLNLK